MTIVLIFLGPEIKTVLADEKKLDVLAVGWVGRVVPSLRAIRSELNELNCLEFSHCFVFLDLVLIHSKMLIIIEESLPLVFFCSSCTVCWVVSS